MPVPAAPAERPHIGLALSGPFGAITTDRVTGAMVVQRQGSLLLQADEPGGVFAVGLQGVGIRMQRNVAESQATLRQQDVPMAPDLGATSAVDSAGGVGGIPAGGTARGQPRAGADALCRRCLLHAARAGGRHRPLHEHRPKRPTAPQRPPAGIDATETPGRPDFLVQAALRRTRLNHWAGERTTDARSVPTRELESNSFQPLGPASSNFVTQRLLPLPQQFGSGLFAGVALEFARIRDPLGLALPALSRRGVAPYVGAATAPGPAQLCPGTGQGGRRALRFLLRRP